MERTVYTIFGILALVTLAAGLTEATMAIGHRGRIFDDKLLRPKSTTTPASSPSPSLAATPIPEATPIPTPAPTPAATPVAPVAPTATTSSFVRMRAGASTSTAVLAELNGGTVVTLGAYRDSQWQQVSYNGQNGYIFRAYLSY